MEDYNFGENRFQIAVVSIELAMDHKPSNREMTSLLLSDLYGQHQLTERELEMAYDKLLINLPDLVLDTPDAPTVLGNFIARSVADDTLAPRFLHNYQGKVECDLAKQALTRADVLLSMKHGMTRLDNVWGVGGGLRPVKSLVRSMGLLLQEYLTSDDTQEASRCLQELEVPHFHHELVYEAILLALEASNEETENSLVKLLKFFYSSNIVTPDQMKNVRKLKHSWPMLTQVSYSDGPFGGVYRASSASWMKWTTSAWMFPTRASTWSGWAASAKRPGSSRRSSTRSCRPGDASASCPREMADVSRIKKKQKRQGGRSQ